uniref:Tetraspanin n=1 Tax=Meloidogyne incognita TaxID=6306 RepID=A0A914L6G5_MELIC
MVEGGITLVKYLLFFANFILWVVGICFLISGILLQMKYSGLLDVLGDERLTTPVILLAIGCLFTLLGFIGYCGAIRENYCLTVSFAVLLALLLMTETAIAILVYALHEPLNEVIVTQLAQWKCV